MDATAASPAHAGQAHSPIARRDVGRHLAVSVPATAIIFAIAGPLVSAAIAWTLLVLIPTVAAVKDVSAVATIVSAIFSETVVQAYATAMIPAAVTGAIVALLSPFSALREQFLPGVASVGAMASYIYAEWLRPDQASFGTPLFLAIVGAGAAILCTVLACYWPLHRIETRRERRERLARERAARLKAAREAAH